MASRIMIIIGSDTGLVPVRHQAIIWTSDDYLSTGSLGTNFNEIFNENTIIFIQQNIFEK